MAGNSNVFFKYIPMGRHKRYIQFVVKVINNIFILLLKNKKNVLFYNVTSDKYKKKKSNFKSRILKSSFFVSIIVSNIG